MDYLSKAQVRFVESISVIHIKRQLEELRRSPSPDISLRVGHKCLMEFDEQTTRLIGAAYQQLIQEDNSENEQAFEDLLEAHIDRNVNHISRIIEMIVRYNRRHGE